MKKIIIFSLSIVATGILFSSFSGKNNKKEKDSEKPNIIFLLTDDQRYNALGCMGNTEIFTPNIDQLASEGTIFTNAYNPTAICMGARASIMTGMYEHKSGCNFQHGPLTKEKFQKSYPVLLRNAGYFTGFTGKFGFAVTESANQNSSYSTNDKMPMDEFDWWKGWPSQGYYQTDKNEFMVEYAEEYPHVSTALGAAAVDFIKESQNQDKPFCLSVSFKAPHNPQSPDKQFDHVYKGKTFSQPENYWLEGAEHIPQQAKSGRQYQRLKDKWSPEKYDGAMIKYYQLIYGIDAAVGMIMEELEKEGLMDNTIIIYTTDNGYFCGSHAFGGKVLPYEEGSRAPLIIYAPENKLKGKKSDALTATIDLAPTMLQMAGVDIPENMDGKSLVPILTGKKKEVKEHQMIIQAWGQNPTHSLSVVHDDFKYLYWFYGGEGMTPHEELYNLKDDPQEMTNLAKNPKMSKQLEKMREIYDEYVENWKVECVQGDKQNYKEYGILYDRNIPWSDKEGIMRKSTDKSRK